MVFGAIGAILIGLALILILAHNWDEMHHYTKIGLAFLPLIFAQGLVVFTLLRRADSKLWKETVAILLFFSMGACMALIAQIYNIEDSGGRFFLMWTALCLPVTYVLRSSAISLLCILCISYFNLSYGFVKDDLMHQFYYYGMIAAVMPHYIYLLKEDRMSNAALIHHWVVALSITICTFTLAHTVSYAMFLVYFSLFALFFNIGTSAYFDKTPKWANAYTFIGQLGIFIVLIILSFGDVWDNIYKEFNTETLVFSREFLMSALYAMGSMFFYFKNQVFKTVHLADFWLILIPFTVIFFMNDFYPGIFINILTLALGVAVLIRGINQENLATLNFGLLIISVLILCRFFDTELSYLVRGLVFALLGTVFFVTNYFMIRKFNRNEA